jgi:enamine deaminase RidA (YjgF/YER057c/UK114 family)
MNEASVCAGDWPMLGGIAYARETIGEGAWLNVPARVLVDGGLSAMHFPAVGAIVHGQHGALRYACTDTLLFGVVAIGEDEFDARVEQHTALQAATEAAYRALFGTLEALGYPALVRTWNYLPDINTETFGLERYRQFNAGRQIAFAEHARPLAGHVPAACALGVGRGPLSVAFLASRASFTPLENPRQVSAYHYPPEYGVRSPTFSRAGLTRIDGRDVLFISGTASIVGHRSLHIGDVQAQTHETLANLAALVERANAHLGEERFALAGLAYTVYLRHGEDIDAVSAILRTELGTRCPMIFVQADICRADLLVEIEAVGGLAVVMTAGPSIGSIDADE